MGKKKSEKSAEPLTTIGKRYNPETGMTYDHFFGHWKLSWNLLDTFDMYRKEIKKGFAENFGEDNVDYNYRMAAYLDNRDSLLKPVVGKELGKLSVDLRKDILCTIEEESSDSITFNVWYEWIGTIDEGDDFLKMDPKYQLKKIAEGVSIGFAKRPEDFMMVPRFFPSEEETVLVLIEVKVPK